MSSVRVSRPLLEALHAASPPGASLERSIRAALAIAGGPDAVRRAIEEEDRRLTARARVARLRRRRHRSVTLPPPEQVALAEAAARWCRTLEDAGRRRFDAGARRLHLVARRDGGRTPRLTRGGRPL